MIMKVFKILLVLLFLCTVPASAAVYWDMDDGVWSTWAPRVEVCYWDIKIFDKLSDDVESIVEQLKQYREHWEVIYCDPCTLIIRIKKCE